MLLVLGNYLFPSAANLIFGDGNFFIFKIYLVSLKSFPRTESEAGDCVVIYYANT